MADLQDRWQEWRNLSSGDLLAKVSEAIGVYEKKARHLAKEVLEQMSERSQLARDNSQKMWRHYTCELRSRSNQLEKKVTQIVQQEAKRLNLRANQFLRYMTSFSPLLKESNGKAKSKAKRIKSSGKKTGHVKVSGSGRNPVATPRKSKAAASKSAPAEGSPRTLPRASLSGRSALDAN